MIEKSKNIHLAIVTLWYPSPKDHLYGVFIRQQALELSKYCKVSIFVARRSLFPSQKKYTDGPLDVYESVGPYLPNTNEKRLTNWSKRYLSALESVHRENKIDIIHCHDYVALYPANLISKELRIPYITTIHNTDFLLGKIRPWRNDYLKRCFSDAENVIAVGHRLAIELENYTSKEKIKVVPNVVNTDAFTLGPDVAEQPFKFLFVGNYEARKNVMLILESFKNLADESHLTCIGYGEQKKEMLAFVKSNALNHRVQILDTFDNEKLIAYYQSHHCYISASTSETFGITVAEAMSCGMHVIYSKSGGPEYFVAPQGSFLLAHLSPGELTKTMQTVKASYNAAFKKSIRNHALDIFGKEKVISRLISIYREIIDENRS